jgi:hypothetical protein
MPLPLALRNIGSLPDGNPAEAWMPSERGGLALEMITYRAPATRLSRRSQRTVHRRHHSASWNTEQASTTSCPCSENWRSDEKCKDHGSVHLGIRVPYAWNVQLE